MKTGFEPSLAALIVAAFLTLSLATTVNATTASSPAAGGDDRAAHWLSTRGTLPIAAVGADVAVGTYRIQVAAKLGQPDLRLADGSWLYHDRLVNGSAAAGTLLVRFNQGGRVASLALVTPAVVAALRDASRPGARENRVAAGR